MRGRLFRFGTLSFAKSGDAMVLSPQARARYIAEMALCHRPRLLITAGYAIDTIRELVDLSRQLDAASRSLALITEVHHESTTRRGEPSKHALWMMLARTGQIYRLGGQAFGKAVETRERSGASIAKLRLQLVDRTVRLGQRRVFGLICGEINIVHGRENLRFTCPHAEAAILAADIVVNPTHDRMGNAGTLLAKRRLLSRQADDGRDRLYISCSNWDVRGVERPRQRPSPTLHTAFRSEVPLSYVELADGRDGFVYRSWDCEL